MYTRDRAFLADYIAFSFHLSKPGLSFTKKYIILLIFMSNVRTYQETLPFSHLSISIQFSLL